MDPQPAQIVMRSPELTHAVVVVNARDREAFEAKGYEYAGEHRAGDPEAEATEETPSAAVDVTPLLPRQRRTRAPKPAEEAPTEEPTDETPTEESTPPTD